MEPTPSEPIRDVLQRKVDAGLPGAFVFIEEPDGTTKFIAAGVADMATSAPMSPDRYYRVGSTTKTFTAVVALQLVAEGQLRLSDLVTKWLPARSVPNGDSLTIEHLLRMRSGLFDFVDDSSLAGLDANLFPHTLEETITLGLGGKPAFLPGERFSYCNTNFCLLEHVVERCPYRREANIYQVARVSESGDETLGIRLLLKFVNIHRSHKTTTLPSFCGCASSLKRPRAWVRCSHPPGQTVRPNQHVIRPW